jgi:hypothetical protein
MNFNKLDQIIQEDKNINIIANYIVENNVNLESFLAETLNKVSLTIHESDKALINDLLNEIGIPADVAADLKVKEQKPGFFQRLRQNFSNAWSNFRGNVNNPASVVNILKKAQEYLGKLELKGQYAEELSQIAKAIEGIKSKQPTTTLAPAPVPDAAASATP